MSLGQYGRPQNGRGKPTHHSKKLKAKRAQSRRQRQK